MLRRYGETIAQGNGGDIRKKFTVNESAFGDGPTYQARVGSRILTLYPKNGFRGDTTYNVDVVTVGPDGNPDWSRIDANNTIPTLCREDVEEAADMYLGRLQRGVESEKIFSDTDLSDADMVTVRRNFGLNKRT